MDTPLIKKDTWHRQKYVRHYTRTGRRPPEKMVSLCHYTHVVIGEALRIFLLETGALAILAVIAAIVAFAVFTTWHQKLHLLLRGGEVIGILVGLTAVSAGLVLLAESLQYKYRVKHLKPLKPPKSVQHRSARGPRIDPGLVLLTIAGLALTAWYFYGWVIKPITMLLIHGSIIAVGLLAAGLIWSFSRDQVKDTLKVGKAFLKAKKLKVCPFVEFE